MADRDLIITLTLAFGFLVFFVAMGVLCALKAKRDEAENLKIHYEDIDDSSDDYTLP